MTGESQILAPCIYDVLFDAARYCEYINLMAPVVVLVLQRPWRQPREKKKGRVTCLSLLLVLLVYTKPLLLRYVIDDRSSIRMDEANRCEQQYLVGTRQSWYFHQIKGSHHTNGRTANNDS